ncbi:MAG: pyrroloquinoline quinone biosynthesis peptide chaperone PqqD [Pseudomonadota bacterium]
MTPDLIPVLPRGVRLHFDKVRDRWVLLAPERAVALDQVGHAVLSEVDGKRSFGDIVAALAAKYNAPPDQISKDSAGFLSALRDRRFLDVSP